MTNKQPKEGKGWFGLHFQVTVHHGGKSGQGLKGRNCGENTACWLFADPYLPVLNVKTGCSYVCGLVDVNTGTLGGQRGIGFLRGGLKGSCEPPTVGAGIDLGSSETSV